MPPTNPGKLLVFLGLGICFLGFLVWGLSKTGLPLGRLPGDIRIERGNFSFYFPLATCMVVSVVLTLVFSLISRIFRN